jgi:hypothetical protein
VPEGTQASRTEDYAEKLIVGKLGEDLGMQAIERFPFKMLLVATLLTGSVFLLVNVPIINLILDNGQVSGKNINTVTKFLVEIFFFWRGRFLELTWLRFAGFLALSMLLGYAVNPFVRILFVGITRLLAMVKLLDPFRQVGKDYAQLIDWLGKHDAERMVWEFELYQYHVYSGIAFSLLVASSLMAIFAWNFSVCGVLYLLVIGAFVIALSFTGIACVNSYQVDKMFDLYTSKMQAERLSGGYPGGHWC